MRSVIRPGLGSVVGLGSVGTSHYPKIKQGYIVDSGGEIILDSTHLAASGVGLMKRENQMFMIKIEARCKCTLHNKY